MPPDYDSWLMEGEGGPHDDGQYCPDCGEYIDRPGQHVCPDDLDPPEREMEDWS